MGTIPLADVRQAGAGGPLMIFQLYVFKNRDFVRRILQRERPRPALIGRALIHTQKASCVFTALVTNHTRHGKQLAIMRCVAR